MRFLIAEFGSDEVEDSVEGDAEHESDADDSENDRRDVNNLDRSMQRRQDRLSRVVRKHGRLKDTRKRT